MFKDEQIRRMAQGDHEWTPKAFRSCDQLRVAYVGARIDGISVSVDDLDFIQNVGRHILPKPDSARIHVGALCSHVS